MAERLLILDSNSIIHRVFHALPRLTTKEGELINAVYGFLLVLFRVLKEFQPNYACACFDFPAKTFRHEKFKEYKSKRPPTPKDLISQIPKIKEILNSFQIPIFEKEGFEADDLIGTIVKKTPSIEKIIVSGDLDTLQLVSKETKVFALRGIKKSILYDEKEVEKKYGGLKPYQISDFKALAGDASDNIPNINGIGPKTALHLILKFGDLDNLYYEIENNSQKTKEIPLKLINVLLEKKAQVFLSRELAMIKTDVFVEFDPKRCSFGNFDENLIKMLFEKLGFKSLVKRLEEIKSLSRESNNLKLF